MNEMHSLEIVLYREGDGGIKYRTQAMVRATGFAQWGADTETRKLNEPLLNAIVEFMKKDAP